MGGGGGGCDRLVIVVGSGTCWQWVVCVYWVWAMVVVHCVFVVSWSLWPFVFVGIIVCGHYGWSSPFGVWAVVVSHRVS